LIMPPVTPTISIIHAKMMSISPFLLIVAPKIGLWPLC
jgi:hypothetical protein